MNAKIDALFSDYCSILDDYRLNINEKNATNFEDSLICKNDIETILKGKFDNIRFSFEEGKEKVSSLKKHFSATDYENTIEMINRFISLSNSYISLIEDTNKQIEVASKAAYEEYCMEFDTYEELYQRNKSSLDRRIEDYNDINTELINLKENKKETKEKINNYSGGDPILYNKLQSDLRDLIDKIGDKESVQETLLENMEHFIVKMENACQQLNDKLEIALKKGTAAQ